MARDKGTCEFCDKPAVQAFTVDAGANYGNRTIRLCEQHWEHMKATAEAISSPDVAQFANPLSSKE